MINLKKIFIPVLILMIWGPPSFRLQQLNTALNDPLAAFDLSTSYRIVVWVIAGGFMLVYVIRSFWYRQRIVPLPLTRGTLKWYTIFSTFAVLSTLISLRPAYTIFFASKLLISCLAVSYMIDIPDDKLTKSNSMKLLNIFYGVYIAQWVAIVILYFVRPELVGNYSTGIGYRLTGMIFNDFGMSAAISGLFFFSIVLFNRSFIKRVFSGAAYSLTWIFVMLSQTRSIILPAALFIPIMIGLYRNLSAKLISFYSLIMMALVVFIFDGGETIIRLVTRGQTIEGMSGLTGRVPAFLFLLSQWRESPIFGYGYAAGNRVFMTLRMSLTGHHLTTAHDIASRVLIDLGIIGAILLSISFVIACKDLFFTWKYTKYDNSLQPITLQLIALMMLSTIVGLTSSGIADIYWPFLVTIGTSQVLRRLAIKHKPPTKSRDKDEVELSLSMRRS